MYHNQSVINANVCVQDTPTALGEIANALIVEVGDYFNLFNEVERKVSRILSLAPTASEQKERFDPTDFVEAAKSQISDFRAVNRRLMELRNHLEKIV